MFWAPLCPSSGAREYYTGGCCLCFGFKVVGMVWSWGLCVRFAGLKTKAPNTTGNIHLYNTLELLMMGIVVPKSCWASNKICNKNHLLHLVGNVFPQTTWNFCRSCRFTDKISLNSLKWFRKFYRQTDRQTEKLTVLSACSLFFS